MPLRCTLIAFCLMAAVTPVLGASRQDHDACIGNDADRIIASCTRIIENKQESDKARSTALVNRAYGWRLKDERNRAIADLSEAIRINPNDALTINIRGNVWREKRELDKAIADYTEAIRINPLPRSEFAPSGRVNIYTSRGVAWHEKEDLDRALADYEQALLLDSKDAEAWYQRSRIHLHRNDTDRAIEGLSMTVQLEPRNSHAWYTRGVLYYDKYMHSSEWIRKEDLDRAIEDFSEVIRREPGWPLGFHARGLAYATRGERERALNDLLVAADLNPHDPKVIAAIKQLKPDYEVPKDPLEKLMKWELPASMTKQ